MLSQYFFSDTDAGFWHFSFGPQVLFGREELLVKLPLLCSGKRVGVLTDSVVEDLRLTKAFLSSVKDRVVASCWIGADSDYDDVCHASRVFKQREVDLVLAIGGGSVLDAAKVVAAAFADDVEPWSLNRIDAINTRPPLIAIPTTFGTGAEMNMYAHLYKRSTGEKISFKKPWLSPDFALVQPDFAKELPRPMKYLCGIDAFVHVLEVLTLKRDRSPVLTQLMQHGLAVFQEHFFPYVQDPAPQHDEAMALVSTLGGLGIHNARTGLIHAMAGPWAKHAQLPHAVSIIPFIQPVLEFNGADICDLLPFGSLAECNEFFSQLLALNTDYESATCADEKICRLLAEECARDKVLFKENPRLLQLDDLEILYRKALMGTS